MPVFLAPGYLVAAVLASAVVTALHLLAWRRPEPTLLPTARFAPSSAVRAVSRALRLSDVSLLVVRVLALLLAGAALAGPTVTPRRSGVARVLLLDASRRVGSMDAVRDSARARLAGADAVVWVRVDSVARLLPDSAAGDRADVRGSLSAGLVAAVQAAHRLAGTFARVEVVVISPFAAESWDAATDAARRAWPGDVEAVRVGARDATAGAGGRTTRVARELPPVDDPIGAVFSLAVDSTLPAIRVRREAPSAADSAWARDGGVVVWWPRAGAGDAGHTSSASLAMLGDGARSAVGHFAALPGVALSGRAILRWGDGAIAAAEESLGGGCLRVVAVGVPDAGDEVLRPGFVRLARGLAMPCGGGSAELVDDETLASWARPVRTTSDAAADAGVATVAGTRADETSVPAGPSATLERWLLAAVAFALLIEWWLRRPRATSAAGNDASVPASRVAA
ncbi:MAG: BatA domain-containing protein [Gemmatimonadaceae bacterium]|nr:BatA domain-containing protein [Gemmatimonadaceae bacterium]